MQIIVHVYIVTVNEVCEGKRHTCAPSSYPSLEEAVKRMEFLKESSIKAFPQRKLEEKENSFSLYVDGNWPMNHIDVSITGTIMLIHENANITITA